ncbi:hypothetical protein GH714_027233 [Hevea brasiliensis]|uniref:PGG domain-containing protein n=1 Tax=Hevea brasiliensis TaxID=3981 RepID=A0A6A6LVD3_HEVBR|nr:hypothetical protein GH714_027233 [Hevea brasiliensis]
MSTISINGPDFSGFLNDGFRNHPRFHRIAASLTVAMDSRSSQTRKKEGLSIQLPAPSISQIETSRLPDLRFDRLQIPEKDLVHEDKLEFGQFVAREAIIDEEFWTAAWLRAESHWEDRTNDRYVDNHKRKFAEQEFHAIKKRRTGLHGQNCCCVVAVRKKGKNVKRTVLKSVVGTLDLSIRCLLQGETFPGERVKVPIFRSFCRRGPSTYGYVANLCVAKSARRQGIASNMLHFAVESAKSNVNIRNLTTYRPLYKAILKGDLETVKSICSGDPLALEARITENLDTALHIAVGTGMANHIVMYLINRMSRLQLGLQNSNGDTVLSIAAIVGNIRAAIMIVNKQPNLPQIANRDGRVPLLEAARHGQKEMISYLLEVSGDYLQAAEYSADKPGVFFMNLLVLAGFYGAPMKLNSGGKPSAVDVENPQHHQLVTGSPLLRARNSVVETLVRLSWRILAMLVPPMKGIRDIKLMHHQTLQLTKCLCTEIACLDYEKASMMLRRPFLLAAELGIYEIMEEIMESFPHAIWFSDNENHNLFHIAVMNRQENVLNLLYQISDYKHRLLVSEDIFGNNILHLAGKLAPQHRLNLISGAALQMQYELRWFKEVEKIVQLACKEDKNSEGRTPAMLFTEEHKRLVKEGEKWMKDTASSCTVAAALIATVIFAAAITVPGGNNNDDGYPIFSKQKSFIIFAVSDALPLFICSHHLSVLVHSHSTICRS